MMHSIPEEQTDEVEVPASAFSASFLSATLILPRQRARSGAGGHDGRYSPPGTTPIFALLRRIGIALMGLALTSCCTTKTLSEPLATAAKVDLNRYVGRWYEIARLPMPFQKAGEAAIAEYGSNPDGTISVHNIAIRPDGSQHDIRGYAKVLNPPENTKLAVRFRTWFGPLIPVPKEGNYWILYVDDQYQEAIVGTQNRKYLWLLARTATIPGPRFAALVAKAEALGFDVSRLIRDPPRQSTPSQTSP